MSNETTYSGILGDLLRLQTALAARVGEVPHLAQSRERFEAAVGRAQALIRDQAVLNATKLERSRHIKEAIGDGLRLATILRKGLLQHYGIRSERLVEFGIQPFRGRKSKSKPEEPEPAPTEAPSAAAE
ncbi:MAG TPA: hypothetical protein VE078_06760 [Thermoanaerobaculia bacterium]|nr:hypothetical protein [Thermoanaerobaculia bacterium]